MKSKILVLLSMLALTPLFEMAALRGGGGRGGGGRGGFGGGRGFSGGGRGFSGGGFSGSRGFSSVNRGYAGGGFARTPSGRMSGVSTGRIERPSTGLRPSTRPSTRPGGGGSGTLRPGAGNRRPGAGGSGTLRPGSRPGSRPGQGLTRFRGRPRAGFRNFDRGVNKQFWNRGFRGRGWNHWFGNYFPFAMGVFPFLYYADYGSYPDVYYDYYDQYGEYPQPIENYDQYVSGALPWPTEGYEEEPVAQPGYERAYEQVVSYEDDDDGDITGPQMIFVS